TGRRAEKVTLKGSTKDMPPVSVRGGRR
ncbi:MAG: hypothetical protein K0S65_3396, partial [Labilithrix sp.]|nr:hypothetical protein [Labilithrix sp.]